MEIVDRMTILNKKLIVFPLLCRGLPQNQEADLLWQASTTGSQFLEVCIKVRLSASQSRVAPATNSAQLHGQSTDFAVTGNHPFHLGQLLIEPVQFLLVNLVLLLDFFQGFNLFGCLDNFTGCTAVI